MLSVARAADSFAGSGGDTSDSFLEAADPVDRIAEAVSAATAAGECNNPAPLLLPAAVTEAAGREGSACSDVAGLAGNRADTTAAADFVRAVDGAWSLLAWLHSKPTSAASLSDSASDSDSDPATSALLPPQPPNAVVAAAADGLVSVRVTAPGDLLAAAAAAKESVVGVAAAERAAAVRIPACSGPAGDGAGDSAVTAASATTSSAAMDLQ